jgi:hypothetical protein
MPRKIAQLLTAMADSKRYIDLLLSIPSQPDGDALAAPSSSPNQGSDDRYNFEDADVLTRCSSEQISALLNHFNRLNRVTHGATETVLRLQRRKCSLEAVDRLSKAGGEDDSGQNYQIEQTELEHLCVELIWAHGERLGVCEHSTVKWYSDSGFTSLERSSGLEGAGLLGLQQDPLAVDARYILKYRNKIIVEFHQHIWPECLPVSTSAVNLVATPRTVYFELLAHHKRLSTQWYRRHYGLSAVNQKY